MNTPIFFQVNHLSGGYPGLPVLHDLSFSLHRGELTGILGPNGCGKSTLIKSLCGLLPYEGSFQLEGNELSTLSIRQRSRLMSYIPQRSGITIPLSALDVVLMGFNPKLGLLQQPSRAMKEAARKALSKVGLEGKEDLCYLELSEGQKQLCILARTLASDCSLILLDEPESALDFSHRYQMMRLLQSWCREDDRCILTILHDPQLALNYCDRLLLMQEGKLVGDICPQEENAEALSKRLSPLLGPVLIQEICPPMGQKQWVILEDRS